MTRLLPIFAVAALSLSLTGCIFFETRAERAMVKDPNFRAGYGDGCASATAHGTDYRRGNDIRDDAAYQTSKPYRSGWAAGYAACNTTRSGTSNPDYGGMPTPKPPGQL
ncbi:MAG TPA: hypothetical protein VGB91_06710 [Rhizomicrobium sp.]